MALITITSLLKQISEKHVNMSYLILIEAYNAPCGVPASTSVALTLIDFFFVVYGVERFAVRQ